MNLPSCPPEPLDTLSTKSPRLQSGPQTSGRASAQAARPAASAALTGGRLLKHRLEADLLAAQPLGPRILEVSRSELPLIAPSQNRQLTRLPAQLPPTELPHPDGSFDAVVAVEVLSHGPDGQWRQRLAEWARVTGPQGRVVFNGYSLEHQQARLGQATTLPQSTPDADGRHIGAAELVAEAEKHGLALVSLTPYGALLGESDPGHPDGGLENLSWLRRLVSWLATDRTLLELVLLIEQELIAQLTPVVAARFMAVFEKRDDPKSHATWLQQSRALDLCLRSVPIDLAGLTALRGSLVADLRRNLTAPLSVSLRGRRLLDYLAAPLVESGRLRWSDLLEPPLAAYFEHIGRCRELDRLASQWASGAAHEVPRVAELLSQNGVPLGVGLEYGLVEPVLTEGFGLFTGVRS